MPSKIQLDENLWFLYICLQKSDLKSIDFAAVGAATSLKPPAARMRYTRLRRQIESGTLIGTHGTPFLSSSFSSPTSPTLPNSLSSNYVEKEMEKKRKRDSADVQGGKRGEEGNGDGMREKIEGGKGMGEGGEKIKREDTESDGYESFSEGWDSEDEVPLAKLRKSRVSASVQAPPAAAVGYYGYKAGYGGGNAGRNGTGSGNEGQRQRGGYGGQRRYLPVDENRPWTGMIPVGNVGIEAYPAYWGNGLSGVRGWEQDEKPRKSV